MATQRVISTKAMPPYRETRSERAIEVLLSISKMPNSEPKVGRAGHYHLDIHFENACPSCDGKNRPLKNDIANIERNGV